ncbi:MAG: erythromycin esterase family protein [Planctomycetaceae bacterium]|nr:erythromycin esterase family protein [Planctomycetaceae bacterium]
MTARVNGAQVVLIGGSSDGTRQFHALRARLTRRLLEHEGFDVLAIDGDTELADDGIDGPVAAPHWSVLNGETAPLLDWMRTPESGRPSFPICGLDVFARMRSLRTAIRLMRRQNAQAAAAARLRYASLTPWQSDPDAFDQASVSSRLRRCVRGLAARLTALLARDMEAARLAGLWHADHELRSSMRRNASEHYHEMLRGHPEAWSMRNRHLAEALRALQRANGSEPRVVIWTSGPNAGDTGATEMGARAEASLGRLVREQFGSRAFLIGMGTHSGTATVASEWDGSPEVRVVPEAHRDSCERLLHETRIPRFLLPLRELRSGVAQAALAEPRLQRYCGDGYRPEKELGSHCYQASLPAQFDEYVWFDQTEALTTGPA